VKRQKIRDLVRRENIDFLAIQETKMEAIPDNFIANLWGSGDCGWVSLPAIGNSGDILSIWNKVKSSLIFSFVGDGFVGVCLNLLDENRVCYVVNVYAKCNIQDKRRLWGNLLMSKEGFGEGLWCVLGDFNSVRDTYERRGINYSSIGGRSLEMVEFDDFVGRLDLFDVPLIGRNFTWFHPNGIAMSRLDRVLISSSWSELWGDPLVRVLDRDVPDHCPIVLSYSSDDWGPKPFRLNNYWLQDKDFIEVVRQAWEGQNYQGWMGFILNQRFKNLKGVIKEWNLNKVGVVEVRKRHLIKRIAELDVKSEVGGLVDVEITERKLLFEKLWKLLKNIDALTFQRSRIKWLKEVDANSRFFHNCIKVRKRMNSILMLRTSEGWVEGPVNVKREVVTFFSNQFANDTWCRPTLDGIVFPCLEVDKVEFLTANFTMEEITDAVRGCDGTKSPGPEGFNFAFIKEFWELMRSDIRILFDQFHGNARLPKSICSYFLALIPKVQSPQSLGDFRPISLLGCIYKLVAKVLASRLAKVIGDLIPNTQSAFLKGRQLVIGVVVVNEVVDYAKKSGKQCLIFKVDFEKAYDSVDWGFLEYMLRRLALGRNGVSG
jgi:hypothetical protein